MCGTVWKFPDDDEFGKVVTNYDVVNPVPIKHLFPGCATGVVELRWHFQLAWLLWNLIGRFHIFPQLCKCCHLFQAKTQIPWLSAYIFPLLGVLHVFAARLSFAEWKVSELWNPWLRFHLQWTSLPDSSNRHRAPVEAAFTQQAIHLKCYASAT